jgi:pseudaminic acid biosynthesis-associated methylase
VEQGFKTEQEVFWAGSFGDDYTSRNQGNRWIASNLAFFAQVLLRTTDVRTVLEIGANLGLNLMALRQLLPQAELSAIEINPKAVQMLQQLGSINVYPQSVLDFHPEYQRDFVLSKGVLIHINPDELAKVYDLLHETSSRYICIAEYYNPTPVEIPYRGHAGKLFKRDFAGEMLDRFKELRLVDYGFIYHRDSNFSDDDLNWFLLEKCPT